MLLIYPSSRNIRDHRVFKITYQLESESTDQRSTKIYQSTDPVLPDIIDLSQIKGVDIKDDI